MHIAIFVSLATLAMFYMRHARIDSHDDAQIAIDCTKSCVDYQSDLGE